MKLNEPNQPRESFPTTLTEEEFNRLMHLGSIVDGRGGGMVLAQQDEPIRMVFKVGGEFMVQGFLEPYSFLVNWEAAAQNLNRLRKMAVGLTLREIEEPRVPELVEYILANAFPTNKLVWGTWGQMIIGREAAAKHLFELTEINRSVNPFWRCDLNAALNVMPGTEDGCV